MIAQANPSCLNMCGMLWRLLRVFKYNAKF